MLYESKEKCCGCSACANSCPINCIKMVEDEEGFLYPEIDQKKCIHCGKCERTCPVINRSQKNDYDVNARVGRIKDDTILKDSTSGGIPTAIFEKLIEEGYSICGALYDDKMQVVHAVVSTIREIGAFRGSKYVQSNINTCFEQIREILENGQKCAFIGTPCQVEGLVNYLNKDYKDQLVLIDLICHGVSSPFIWKKYVEEMNALKHSEAKKIKFRNKTYGYHSSTMMIEFKNGKEYYASGRTDPMLKAFFGEIVSRPSCYQCRFKSIKHRSDLSLFDCKRYGILTGKADDDKGYTAILVQSPMGEKLLDLIADRITNYEVDLVSLIKADGVMVENSAKPHKNRDVFIRDVKKNNNFHSTVYKYFGIGPKDHILEKSKTILYKTGLLALARRIKKMLR